MLNYVRPPESYTKHSASVTNQSNSSRPYTTVNIAGQDITGLFDTGSDITLISSKILEELKSRRKLEPQSIDVNACAANSTKLAFKGCYLVRCQYEQKVVERHKIYVCDDLSDQCIIGTDLIRKLNLAYDPINHKVFRISPILVYNQGETLLDSRSCTGIRVKIRDDSGKTFPNQMLMIDIAAQNCPTVYTHNALIQTDPHSIATIYLVNAGKCDLKIPRQLQVGTAETITEDQIKSLKPAGKPMEVVSAVKSKVTKTSDTDRNWIRENIPLKHLSPEIQAVFYEVLDEFHHVFSRHKWDVGKASTTHKIELTSKEPIFQRQWPLPWASTEIVREYIREWLMYDIIAPLEKDSPYNTALFVIDKKPDLEGNVGHRVCLDFRNINAKSKLPKYRLPLISECVQNIARKNPSCFCILDITSSFYHVPIDEDSQILTSFSVPGTGRFYFKRGCFGLAGLPITWQRYIDAVFSGQQDVWPYFDDIFIAGKDPADLAQTLRRSLKLLSDANLKIHPKKSSFCCDQINYLGFRISKDGYTIGDDNIKAIQKAPCPSDIKGIRSFLGLTGYYRDLCPYYAKIMTPLTKLTRKSSNWHGGPLPQEAKEAFFKMKNYLITRPSLNFPSDDPSRKFHLFTDAASGEIEVHSTPQGKKKDVKLGALGSVLFQENGSGQMIPISYHSRGLKANESNYSSYLLEMSAAIFGIEKNSHFLFGRPFILYVDNKPLEEIVSKTNVKTLNRLQAMMSEYNFTIQYVNSSSMAADFCSRYASAEVEPKGQVSTVASKHPPFVDEKVLLERQKKDPISRVLYQFVKEDSLPENVTLKGIAKRYGPSCIVTDTGYLMCQVSRTGRYALVLPAEMHSDIISASHTIDHQGVDKCQARIEEVYTYPGIRKDISEFVEDCFICQKKSRPPKYPKAKLQPMLPRLLPLEKIHIDLYGPIPECRGYKYILVVTCASSRFTRFIPLRTKEPNEVARKLFDHWIAVFSVPSLITSDLGNECHSSIIFKLCEILGVNKLSTSAYHPAGNASAETRMPFITNYLKASIAEIGYLKDWVSLLPCLTLSFNTGISRMTQESPHFLLYGCKPRLSVLDPEVPLRHYYGNDYNSILTNRLAIARKVARQVNLQHVEKYKEYHDQKVRSDDLKPSQLVWLFKPKSSKLELEYTGPYVVLKLVGDCNAVIQDVLTHKTKFVHLNRLKLYTSRLHVPEKPDQDEVDEVMSNDKETRQRTDYPADVKIELNEVILLSPEEDVLRHKPKTIKEEQQSDHEDSFIEILPDSPSKSTVEKIVDLVPSMSDVREAARDLVSRDSRGKVPKTTSPRVENQLAQARRLTRGGAKKTGEAPKEYPLPPTRKKKN